MLVVEVLDGKKQDRKKFECDSEELNLYLKERASQDVREGYCQVYVVAQKKYSNSKKTIYGFFTLSQYTLEYDDIAELPDKCRKKYNTVPAILLGRLAKDKNQDLLSGSELLLLALRESKSAYNKLGGVFIITHPKDNRAKKFYLKHGFSSLPSKSGTLVLPVKNIP